MDKKTAGELPVIERARALILWYVPFLNKLPRDHKHLLGDRIATNLYELLDELIKARYSQNKLAQLQASNLRLELLRQQTRLLLDFKLMDGKRFEHVARLTNEVGYNLGAWLKQQRRTEPA